MRKYELTYVMTQDLQSRSTTAWTKPKRNRVERRRRVAVGAVAFVVSVAALVALLHYDLISKTMLFSAAFGFYLGIVVWLLSYRFSMAKLSTFAKEALERQGPIHAEFCAEHVTMKTDINSGTMSWRSFDEMYTMKDATGLRAGALMYAVPDSALPDGVRPNDFRADLMRWMEETR